MNFKVIAIAICILGWLSLSATAQSVDKVLANGLRVVVVENHASPTASVNLFIAAGSIDETPAISGLAHFFEHLFFRGTPSLSGLEFKKAIESIGGQTNASTAKDMTHFFINLPADRAERGISLLCDALLNASLDPKGIDAERDVVLEELRLGENNVGRLANEELYKLAYGSHPYAQSTIGSKEVLKKLERADFVKWRNRNYTPSRCTIVVVGDVESNKIFTRAKQLLGSWNPGSSEPRKLALVPEPPKDPVIKEGNGPVSSPIYFIGFPAPAASSKDVYAVDVLSFLLGQGKQSILWSHLVKDQKLAEQIDVSYLTPLQRGLLVVTVVSSERKSAELKVALAKELQYVVRGEFTEEDVLRAKEQLIGTYLLQNQSNSGLADSIGFYASLGLNDFPKTYVQEIEGVDKAAVVRAASTYMGGGYWGYVMRPKSSGKSSR